MSNDISLNYGDVLKAYQTKSSELLTQLTTAEAKLIASANLIMELKDKVSQLEEENKKLQKSPSSSKNKKTINDDPIETVVDYNS